MYCVAATEGIGNSRVKRPGLGGRGWGGKLKWNVHRWAGAESLKHLIHGGFDDISWEHRENKGKHSYPMVVSRGTGIDIREDEGTLGANLNSRHKLIKNNAKV